MASAGPWPDVRTGLEALRHAHVISTLFNGHIALLVDFARHGDLRFDCVLSAELMLVAAHPWALDGARAAGVETAFVARPLEYGIGSSVHEDPGADVSAGDLHELAELLAH